VNHLPLIAELTVSMPRLTSVDFSRRMWLRPSDEKAVVLADPHARSVEVAIALDLAGRERPWRIPNSEFALVRTL